MPGSVKGQGLCGVLAARGGGVWVAMDREVWRWRAGRWELRGERPEGMREDPVAMLEDSRGGLWAGGWVSGLMRFDGDGGVAVATGGQGLASSSVTSLVEDDSGNVWAGSNGGFVARLRPRSIRLFGAEAGLMHVINSVAEEAPGVLAVGTHGAGLLQWKDGRFSRHPAWTGDVAQGGVAVHAVLRDRSGDLWLGTHSPGLMRLHEGRWEVVPANITGAQIIRTLHEDRRGRLWVGTAAGVAMREEGRFRVLGEADGIPHMVVHAMAEDAEGRMWVCGMGYGLFRMGDGKFERVNVEGVHERATFASLAPGRDGSMWVGLAEGAVVRVRGGRARAYRASEGMFVRDALTLMEDGEGDLWAWTMDRCMRVPATSFDAVDEGRATRLALRTFDRRDGFPGAARMGFGPVVAKGAGGRMWWATVKGLALVEPGRLPRRAEPPGIAWRWLRHGGTDVAGTRILDREVDLGPVVGDMEVGFRAARFGSAEHVRYESRLMPHGAWHAVTAEERVSAKDLRPGQYRLEVRASERDGEWGGVSALRFEVPTPVWLREWFLVMGTLGAVGVAAKVARGVSDRRMRRRMRRMEQENLLERERTRIAQNLHDDLGASVTRVALLLERAVTAEPGTGAAMERVREGLELVRGTMGSLDAAVWAVNPDNDTLSELVAYLGQVVVDFCHSAGMRPVLELPDASGERRLGSEWRHHAVLIVKEAVNNAVKHSGGTEVRLGVKVMDEGMEITVADNGRGLASDAMTGAGSGLGNLRSRACAMGGRMEILGLAGGGTRVSAFLPWPKSGETEDS